MKESSDPALIAIPYNTHQIQPALPIAEKSDDCIKKVQKARIQKKRPDPFCFASEQNVIPIICSYRKTIKWQLIKSR